MPSVVQTTVLEAFTPGSPYGATFSSPVTAGNAIVVVAACQEATVTFNSCSDGTNSYQTLAGASCFSATDGNGTAMQVYAAFNVVGGTAYTVSITTTGAQQYLAVYAFEVSGITAYDNGTGATGSSTGNASTGNFATSFSGEIVIAATINQSTSTGPGSGYTLIQLTSSFTDCLEYALVGAGTQNASATMDGSSQGWGIVAAAFYGVTAPPTPGCWITITQG